MPVARSFVALVCVVFLTVSAWGQTQPATTTAPVMPKAEPVMKHIPAGAMGFVVVNNIQDSAARTEKFLKEIGVWPMLGLDGMPGGLVGLLQMQAMLGEGFNPNGGFAAVLLDPQQFGVDLIELMGPGGPPKMPATAPSTQVQEKKVPVILLVPGKGVEEIFGNYPIEQAGAFQKVSLRMGPMLAAKCGDYVALSPSGEALTALLEAKTKATQELNSSQCAALAKAGIAVHINMKIAGPIVAQLMKRSMQQMAAMQGMGLAPGGPTELTAAVLPFYIDMLEQMDGVTISGRFVETGMVISELVACNPQSEWGKAMASCKSSGGKLLDKLPNLSYVLAVGSNFINPGPEAQKLPNEMFDKILASEVFAAVPEETIAKAKDIITTLNEQVQGSQFVAGGAPEGSGLLGLAYVIKCEDAEVVKELLADGTSVVESFIKALIRKHAESEGIEGLLQLRITYVKGVESIGTISVDAIDIIHPKIEQLFETGGQEAPAGTTKPLGEDTFEQGIEPPAGEIAAKIVGEKKIRIRVAAVDKNTVVITFGGASAFTAEAIKAAQKGGTILSSEGLAESMKYMPENCGMLVLFNAGNLWELVVKGMKTVDEEAVIPPFKIATKTPVAIGAAISGSEMEAVLYVPNSLLKDITGIITSMFMPAPPPAAPPMRGAEDF